MALSSAFCICSVVAIIVAITASFAEACVIPDDLLWVFDNTKSLDADSKFYIKTRHAHMVLQSEYNMQIKIIVNIISPPLPKKLDALLMKTFLTLHPVSKQKIYI